ncbi:MAG: hypothetical protein LBC64_10080 [Fibromonadaceae bacterium]|jgi:hypothetical protein|nr:hypothetical protein [Fibromonadaceae bacterium]
MTDNDWRNLLIDLAETNLIALRHSSPQIRDSAIRIQMNLFNIYNTVSQNPSSKKALEIYGFLQELHSKYVAELSELAKTEHSIDISTFYHKCIIKS